MSKKRDFLSIVADILEAAHSGTSKTRIMHSANLSFQLLEKYLETVISSGLIEVKGSAYTLTDRGRVFLKKYELFQGRYAKAQKMLEDLSCERDQLSQLCKRRSDRQILRICA